jgi:hypothetical protein
VSATNPGDRQLEQLLAEPPDSKRYRASSRVSHRRRLITLTRCSTARGEGGGAWPARPLAAPGAFVSIAAVLVVSATVTILIVNDAHLPPPGTGLSRPLPCRRPLLNFPDAKPAAFRAEQPILRRSGEQRTDAGRPRRRRRRASRHQSSALSGTTTGVRLEKRAASVPQEKASEPESPNRFGRGDAQGRIPEAETSAHPSTSGTGSPLRRDPPQGSWQRYTTHTRGAYRRGRCPAMSRRAGLYETASVVAAVSGEFVTGGQPERDAAQKSPGEGRRPEGGPHRWGSTGPAAAPVPASAPKRLRVRQLTRRCGAGGHEGAPFGRRAARAMLSRKPLLRLERDPRRG